MERKIGEIFEFEGKQYEVCKTNKKGVDICSECDIRNVCEQKGGSRLVVFAGECVGDERGDRRDVVFNELVSNVKTFNG